MEAIRSLGHLPRSVAVAEQTMAARTEEVAAQVAVLRDLTRALVVLARQGKETRAAINQLQVRPTDEMVGVGVPAQPE